MTRPFSLQTVLDLMQQRNDEATQRLARLIAAEMDARKQLELLHDYRHEYSERFRQAASNGLSLPEWRNYEDFLSRLDEAVSHQLQALRARQSQTAEGQAAWQEQRVRLQAFATLAQRHQAAEARSDLRREQKTQDEFAARHHDRPDEP
ncbi:flagellar export protein FliJ [Accumulibacter sp.]|uniref:flagellar export protein FliJ n=1 Tax=Accumulibacter sp. TaxID=2053492 RepID=UPI0025FD4269|nr:flagellar export protein FliJ [Accumulibacter sp.]MCM8596256.1 flagellar export protein FliJ [Accumulibacter sp.]MCM8627187.1 flagellar export protein FliJ [Accumulibacter sp.]MDS4050405.1 flagellar export protein FliJ [Accumulibacter sp.]